MIVTTKVLLDTAMKDGTFAIPAFNVQNMEYTKGVIAAAEEMHAPVILMLGQGMLPYAGTETLINIAKFEAERTSVPIAIMLDHGRNPVDINTMLDRGVCIMFDGSSLPFEENVAQTKAYADKAHAMGLCIEGEIGALAGSEDGEEAKKMKMTSPMQAEEFARRTRIDAIAVSIGNSHGLYRGETKIDFERLAKIKEVVKIPIVMHGGSDLPDEISKKIIAAGVSKFNIGTDLKIAFSEALKESLSGDPMEYQPPVTLGKGIQAVKNVALQKIKMMSADGKAALFYSKAKCLR